MAVDATTGKSPAATRQPGNPVFTLIEKAFGKDVTTRTWDTVKKCAAA